MLEHGWKQFIREAVSCVTTVTFFLRNLLLCHESAQDVPLGWDSARGRKQRAVYSGVES